MSLGYWLSDRVLFGSHRFAVPLQCGVQRLLGGPRPASFPLDGHAFHCTTAHRYYFERSDYERELWPVLRRSVTLESVVYDVGAHFGFWVTRLATLVHKVYAFEPSPANLRFLRRNIGNLSNGTVVEAAVGSQAIEVAFSEGGSASAVGTGQLVVPMVTLDDFARSHEMPNLLLIDVEGYGGEVLRGAWNVLRTRPTIVCEVHNSAEEEDIFSQLSNQGYTVRRRSVRYPYRIVAH